MFAILSSALGTIGSNYILHDAATRDAQRAVVAAQTSAQTAATTEAKVTKIAKAVSDLIGGRMTDGELMTTLAMITGEKTEGKTEAKKAGK